LGSIVQKGMFSAGTFSFDKRLNVLLLPILAIPKSPILSEVPGRPSRTLFWMVCFEKLNFMHEDREVVSIRKKGRKRFSYKLEYYIDLKVVYLDFN
jgi:hypothetical protein